MGRTHLVQFVQERDLRLVRLEARLAGRARWVRLLRHLSHRAPGAHRLSARLWYLVPKTDMCMHMHMHMHMLTCACACACVHGPWSMRPVNFGTNINRKTTDVPCSSRTEQPRVRSIVLFVGAVLCCSCNHEQLIYSNRSERAVTSRPARHKTKRQFQFCMLSHRRCSRLPSKPAWIRV